MTLDEKVAARKLGMSTLRLRHVDGCTCTERGGPDPRCLMSAPSDKVAAALREACRCQPCCAGALDCCAPGVGHCSCCRSDSHHPCAAHAAIAAYGDLREKAGREDALLTGGTWIAKGKVDEMVAAARLAGMITALEWVTKNLAENEGPSWYAPGPMCEAVEEEIDRLRKEAERDA